MKAHARETLQSIANINDTTEQLVTLLSLPDVKFDKIYPELLANLQASFNSPSFQRDVLQTIENTHIENIDDEKASVTELLEAIDEDDSISDNKKHIMHLILEKSSDAVYELYQNPRERIEVKIKVLPGGKIPEYAHPTDAGADIYASEPTNFEPGETKIVHTAIQVAIPAGYEIQIRPRSGMSLKTGFRVANAPGTIKVA